MNSSTNQTTHPSTKDARSADELPLRELLTEDFVTHDRRWVEPGFWAVAAHRLGTRVERVKPAVLLMKYSIA